MKKFKKYIINTNIYILLIPLTILAIIMIAFGPDLVKFILGNNYHQNANNIILGLAFCIICLIFIIQIIRGETIGPMGKKMNKLLIRIIGTIALIITLIGVITSFLAYFYN